MRCDLSIGAYWACYPSTLEEVRWLYLDKAAHLLQLLVRTITLNRYQLGPFAANYLSVYTPIFLLVLLFINASGTPWTHRSPRASIPGTSLEPAVNVRNATQEGPDGILAEVEVDQEPAVDIKEEEDSQPAIDMAQLPAFEAPAAIEDSQPAGPIGTRTRSHAATAEVATSVSVTPRRYTLRERKVNIESPPPVFPVVKPTRKAAAKKAVTKKAPVKQAPVKKPPAKTQKNNTKASGSKAKKQSPKKQKTEKASAPQKQPAKRKTGRR